jgi:hypothetical protein
MNKIKLSLASVITLLTAIVFGFICFLGINFYTFGNTAESISKAVIIIVLLCSTALGTKIFKQVKGNFKTNFIAEISLLIVFTGLMVYYTYNAFGHYFVVSEKKEVIQNKLNTSIEQVQNMFIMYDKYIVNREYNYRNKLLSIVKNEKNYPKEFDSCGFNKNLIITPYNKIQIKLANLRKDLFLLNSSDTTNRNGLKETAIAWLTNAKNDLNNWKPIGVVKVANEIEFNSKNWLQKLEDTSKARQVCEKTNDFYYNLNFSDVSNYFKEKGMPTLLSMGLSFIAYLLMLLPWFIAKRDGKGTGAGLWSNKIAPYEVEL